MAQYLTINSTFKPYTFDELLKPVQLYGEEYARQEAALGELQTKADMWKNIVNETNDPKAYKMYESYMQGIEDITNSLMEGLSPTTRKGVLDMTKRYASDIVPIEQAYTRRQELIDEQRKALANDDSLLFSTDASMLSLDQLIDNPATSYISASRSKAHKALADDAKALQDAIRNNPDEWKPILGNQYYERVSTYGFTEQEVYDAIMGNPNANPILTNLLDQHMSKFNAFDATQKALAYRSVAPALYNAIGKQDIDRVQNQGWQPKPDKSTSGTINSDIKLWDYVGTEIDPTDKQITDERNTNDAIYHNELSIIQQLKQEGVPTLTDIYQASILNPEQAPYLESKYNKYQELVNKYGISDLNQIETMLSAQYNAKDSILATINKYTYLNNTASSRLSKYLSTQLLSGQSEDTIDDKIWEEDEKGQKKKVKSKDAKVNLESIGKTLTSPNLSFQVNFNNGKVRIVDFTQGKNWYVNPKALNNLTVIIPIIKNNQLSNISMPADQAVETIVNMQDMMKKQGMSRENIDNNIEPIIEAFYLSLDATIRELTPELSSSTTK